MGDGRWQKADGLDFGLNGSYYAFIICSQRVLHTVQIPYFNRIALSNQAMYNGVKLFNRNTEIRCLNDAS